MIFSFSGTAALEEDAQILKVIEAYCTSAKTRQTLNSSKKFLSLPHTCVHRRGKASQWCLQGLPLFSAVYRSLTQKFLTAPSNRIFSFCLSSTPRSFAFFFLVSLEFCSHFCFLFPHIQSQLSFILPSCIYHRFYDLRLVADPHTPPYRLVLLFDHHLPPPHLLSPRAAACSLAGH